MNPSPQAPAPAGTGPISVGAVVAGRYRVTARLGAGGMATIYRAVDTSLERDVAIKVLHPHLADDPALLARFKAEARAAAGLLHPNIVNVFDQGVADLPYIVMEYVDGPSLREVLARRGRLSAGEALAVIEPVCRALSRAHAAGVIHRDIKPENILIAADGTVKVADFGIARAVAEAGFTATGTLVGSVHYLAGELMGGSEATALSDQYSVGVVLFELLTGRKPLPAETPMAVAMRHARERIPPVRTFVSDVPARVDAVIARATSPVPGKRFDDLIALAAALHAAVPNGPTRVVVDGDGDDNSTLTIVVDDEPTVSVATPPRRRRRRWPLIALLVAALLAGGAFSLWNWVIAPASAAPALVGLTEAEAENVASEAGIAVVVTGAEHDLTIPEGHVLRQDPDRDATVRRGDTIAVVLSEGPARIRMPDVEGKPAQRANQILKGAPNHLDVKTVQVFSDEVAQGRVVSQSLVAGKRVLQGAEVTVKVSKGIEQVTVPSVVGRSRDEAVAALEQAKLRYAITETYSDSEPQAGTVLAQSVQADTTVDKATTVALTISKGPLTISLADYVGDGLSQARTALSNLGLHSRVIEQPRPLIGPMRQGSFGRVEAQAPDPGTKVKRGEPITLYTFSKAAEAESDG